MKALDITYTLFGGSVGGSGRRKGLLEVFRGSVLGAVIVVFLRKNLAAVFGGSVRRKKLRKNNNVTGTVMGVSFNTHVRFRV